MWRLACCTHAVTVPQSQRSRLRTTCVVRGKGHVFRSHQVTACSRCVVRVRARMLVVGTAGSHPDDLGRHADAAVVISRDTIPARNWRNLDGLGCACVPEIDHAVMCHLAAVGRLVRVAVGHPRSAVVIATCLHVSDSDFRCLVVLVTSPATAVWDSAVAVWMAGSPMIDPGRWTPTVRSTSLMASVHQLLVPCQGRLWLPGMARVPWVHRCACSPGSAQTSCRRRRRRQTDRVPSCPRPPAAMARPPSWPASPASHGVSSPSETGRWSSSWPPSSAPVPVVASPPAACAALLVVVLLPCA